MVVNMEDAGFEIRDQIQWIYGSGFPKSHNIGKAYDKKMGEGQSPYEGWGTALKPANEPICLGRKPFKGTVVNNVIKWETGGMNIDECRVGTETISIHNAPKGTFAGGEPDRGSDTSSYRYM
jgi:site-specific DNA-methyltransferase (adenine-specific)